MGDGCRDGKRLFRVKPGLSDYRLTICERAIDPAHPRPSTGDRFSRQAKENYTAEKFQNRFPSLSASSLIFFLPPRMILLLFGRFLPLPAFIRRRPTEGEGGFSRRRTAGREHTSSPSSPKHSHQPPLTPPSSAWPPTTTSNSSPAGQRSREEVIPHAAGRADS